LQDVPFFNSFSLAQICTLNALVWYWYVGGDAVWLWTAGPGRKWWQPTAKFRADCLETGMSFEP